jgi:hypothetical protein
MTTHWDTPCRGVVSGDGMRYFYYFFVFVVWQSVRQQKSRMIQWLQQCTQDVLCTLCMGLTVRNMEQVLIRVLRDDDYMIRPVDMNVQSTPYTHRIIQFDSRKKFRRDR